MSKGDTAELDVLKFILNATSPGWAGYANVFISLHTADPGEAGNQTTNEANYTNYARQPVARSTGGFTATNPSTNVAAITFPQCGINGNTITHVAIGTVVSSTGQILYSGALASPIIVSSLITPQFAIGALSVAED